MAGALRRAGLILALPAVVGVSTLLHWLAGRRLTGLWIMPDEAIYGQRAIEFWHHFSLPVLNGEGAGYSVLYPVVAGIPLSVGDIDTGYASLKLLQALVMSLAAVPVFYYGRRVMPNRYALLAAALTVASPLLLYTGLVMTEVLYYPLAALALLASARAVETTTRRDQVVALALIVVAVLTRVQAIVFVAVLAASIVLDAAFDRDFRRLRAFVPVWAVLVVGAIAAAARPGLFGAYAGTVNGSYPIFDSLKFVYYHLAYAVLSVAVVPVAALAVLVGNAVLGRERDRGARAIVSVALCALVLVVVQVGMFSARYAPHLLGRDLSALPPILFVVLCLWLARGCPRPGVVTSICVLAVAVVVVAAPWNDLFEREALPDTMGITMFLGHGGVQPATLVAVATVVLLVLFRFLPRRAALLLPTLVLAGLIATSVSASDRVADDVQFDQAAMLGTPRDWIQQTVHEPVTYVFNGDVSNWNVVWQQRFWNPRIENVVALDPWSVPGPLPSKKISTPASGRLPIGNRYVVANDRDVFIGQKIAHQDRGTEQYGLDLWKVTPPARISTITNGVKPNGDIISTAEVTAFDCVGGQLELTLLPKATDDVSILLDGKTILQAHIAGLDYWNGTAYVPPTHRSGVCKFRINGGLLLGSTQIAFARPGG
jgi:hypothetical protein